MEKNELRKNEEARIEAMILTPVQDLSRCELAYTEYVKTHSYPQVLDKLELFFQFYEKTDKFIGRTPLYEIRQCRSLGNGELKAVMIFRKAELKPETLRKI